MPERIFIGVAWPYANGDLHLGHLAGCFLPADVFARYHRLAGHEVLMVSGSDCHGTPVTLRAEAEGVTPAEIAHRFHQRFVDTWGKLGISWDLYTRTTTENHEQTAQELFTRLYQAGLLETREMTQFYDQEAARWLPDRLVEGTCGYCDYDGARGDQCDRCGRPLDLETLKEPRSKLTGARPVIRATEHFFLKLDNLQPELEAYVSERAPRANWRSNVLNFTNNWFREGLRDRAITRDLQWGIPVPLEGYQEKCLYVWFEAVMGYFSASKEWAELEGQPDAWKRFWEPDGSRAYYFIGKDNIPFHTILWPAILKGVGGLNLPWDVPANEYLTLEGQPFSTSRNWALWAPDVLSRYDVDPLRYALAANFPESGDTDFSWREFFRRNNDELVATYGNLANRILGFAFKHWSGQVPGGSFDAEDEQMVAAIQPTLDQVAAEIEAVRLKAGLHRAFQLAHEANRWLDGRAPWKKLKSDRDAAGATVRATLQVLEGLSVVLSPYLPGSSARLRQYLGLHGAPAGWRTTRLEPGQALAKPAPLFHKFVDVDERIAAETARLEKQTTG